MSVAAPSFAAKQPSEWSWVGGGAERGSVLRAGARADDLSPSPRIVRSSLAPHAVAGKGPTMRTDADGLIIIDREVVESLIGDPESVHDFRKSMDSLGVGDDDDCALVRLAMQYHLAYLPDEWRRIRMADSSLLYFNIDTGEASIEGPLFSSFAEKADALRTELLKQCDETSHETYRAVHEAELFPNKSVCLYASGNVQGPADFCKDADCMDSAAVARCLEEVYVDQPILTTCGCMLLSCSDDRNNATNRSRGARAKCPSSSCAPADDAAGLRSRETTISAFAHFQAGESSRELFGSRSGTDANDDTRCDVRGAECDIHLMNQTIEGGASSTPEAIIDTDGGNPSADRHWKADVTASAGQLKECSYFDRAETLLDLVEGQALTARQRGAGVTESHDVKTIYPASRGCRLSVVSNTAARSSVALGMPGKATADSGILLRAESLRGIGGWYTSGLERTKALLGSRACGLAMDVVTRALNSS